MCISISKRVKIFMVILLIVPIWFSIVNYFLLPIVFLIEKTEFTYTTSPQFESSPFIDLPDFIHSNTYQPLTKNEPIKQNHFTENVAKEEIKNYPNYPDDNLHSEWNFKISRNYEKTALREWSEPHHTVEKPKQYTQCENGMPFVALNVDEKIEIGKVMREHRYNIYASDKMSLHRSLPDYRPIECRNLTYPKHLPTVSIIIIFHNEAWSTLLRTVWSIIDHSPSELLQEILLIDDESTWESLQRPLDDYIELLPANVEIIRTKKREGLIRARLIGAKIAKGSVLVFLDAHIECTEGWLQPILSRISYDRSVVAVPKINGINAYTMQYDHNRWYTTELKWDLMFTLPDVPERERQRINYDKTAPLRTPTHVGCAFAIDREFFFEIGSYDEQMDIWGSENVELAFRVWMCGGSLEIITCSAVGHLYRRSTYSFDGDKAEIISRNNVRLVEVWMDEFKDFYYAANPSAKNISAGDLTERKNLRKQLNCKNFRWYLENVFPESNMLKEYIAKGDIRSDGKNMCFDVHQDKVNQISILYSCHGMGGNQCIGFTKSGQLITIEGNCVGKMGESAVLVKCTESDPYQMWDYNFENKWIVHRQSNLCMLANDTITFGTCNSTDTRYQWTINLKYK